MQVRRPDGGIVPSTASRRFTSDARSQTACAPWMESRFLFHEARPGLPGEFVTAHVCAQTRHPHGHSGHCRSEKHPARLMLSSLPVNLAGFLQPHLRVSQFVADPILLHPGPMNAGEQQDQRGATDIISPAPLDREGNLECSKLAVTHLSSRQVVSRRWTSSEVWPYRLTDCSAISTCITL